MPRTFLNVPPRRAGQSQQRFCFEALEPKKMLATLLVNFANNSPDVEPVAAADFAAADARVDLNAPINEFDQTANGLTGADGVEFDVTIQPGSSFTTDKGLYETQPIHDSYLFHNSTSSFRSVTVSSLEELAADSTVTFTLHGVGDATNQDTDFRLTYNGVDLGIQETDYDSEILSDTFVSYSFTKVAGVDSVEIEFRNAGNGGGSGAFGGFSVTTASQAIRINAGGDEHTDSEGNVFLEDQFFSGGGTFSVTDDIFIVGSGNNTSNDEDVDDILYQTERFAANLQYDIPVGDGIYDVRLHFAEIFFDQENQRVFDVSIEGLTVLDNFDIFGTRFNAFTPGNFASLVLDFDEIDVSDGFLNLVFESQGPDGINNAKVSAIEVIPVEEPSIVLIPTGGSTVVAEGGTSDSFDVVLTQQPTANVTVDLTPDDQVAISSNTITFTPDNFDVPQTIIVSAVQDSDEEGQQNVPISLVGTSSDPAYDGRSRTLNVTVIDDDLVEAIFESRDIATFDNPLALSLIHISEPTDGLLSRMPSSA